MPVLLDLIFNALFGVFEGSILSFECIPVSPSPPNSRIQDDDWVQTPVFNHKWPKNVWKFRALQGPAAAYCLHI